jgi:hypothetical protein
MEKRRASTTPALSSIQVVVRTLMELTLTTALARPIPFISESWRVVQKVSLSRRSIQLELKLMDKKEGGKSVCVERERERERERES